MRILKEGDPSKKKKEKFWRCSNCDCEFMFTQDEIKREFAGPYRMAFIRCPYCGASLLLEKEKIDGN